MTVFTVYLDGAASPGGTGTEGSPYNTIDAFESGFLTHFAGAGATSKNLTSAGDAIILVVSGTVSTSTRHDLDTFTATAAIGTNPGDTGTLWIQGKNDANRVNPATGVGHGFTNTSTGFETMLLRCNIGLEWLSLGGADMAAANAPDVTNHCCLRTFGGNVSMVVRNCYNVSNRGFITDEAASSTTQVLLQNCVLGGVNGNASGRDECARLSLISNIELNHCVIETRFVNLKSTGTTTWESCLDLNQESDNGLHYFHASSTVNMRRNSHHHGSPASESDSNWFATVATDERYGDTAVSSGWFNDAGARDFNLTSTGDTAIGAAGGGTSVSNVLSADFNGAARASGSAAIGPFEYDAGGGGTEYDCSMIVSGVSGVTDSASANFSSSSTMNASAQAIDSGMMFYDGVLLATVTAGLGASSQQVMQAEVDVSISASQSGVGGFIFGVTIPVSASATGTAFAAREIQAAANFTAASALEVYARGTYSGSIQAGVASNCQIATAAFMTADVNANASANIDQLSNAVWFAEVSTGVTTRALMSAILQSLAVIAPPEQTFTVPHDSRSCVVAVDGRIFTVSFDVRKITAKRGN